MKTMIRLTILTVVVLLVTEGKLFGTDVVGIIYKDTTWTAAGNPYLVKGGMGIVIGVDATLAIEPGVVVKFDPNLAIVVGSASWGKGTLVARGTGESPITFTSRKDPNDPFDPPKPGDWSRIHFTDYAVDAVCEPNGEYVSGCILEHVIVEYAGYGNYSAVVPDQSSPFLNYCEIRHNSNCGVLLSYSTPPMKISNCEIWDHPASGIQLEQTSGHTLLNNYIHDNQAAPIYNGRSYGGGIFLSGSSNNSVIGNTVSSNVADYGGGVCFVDYWGNRSSNNILTGCRISGNIATYEGGGICLTCIYSGPGSSETSISGSSITHNKTVLGTTGGIYASAGGLSLAGEPSTATFNIIQDNDGWQVCNPWSFDFSGFFDVNARYVQWGTCDIEQILDGIFDYHDDSTKAFVVFYPFVCPGDFNVSGAVYADDLAALCDNWLYGNCGSTRWCQGADLDLSGSVDMLDFSILADNWLWHGP